MDTGHPSREKRPVLRTDPLTSHARSLHKNCLLVSGIVIAVIHVGIIPKKLSVLGIDFDQIDLFDLLIVAVVVQVYFLVAFAIAIFKDVAVWRIENEVAEAYLKKLQEEERETEDMLDHYWPTSFAFGSSAGDHYEPLVDAQQARRIWDAAKPYSGLVGKIRFGVDLVLPIVLLVYGIILSGLSLP